LALASSTRLPTLPIYLTSSSSLAGRDGEANGFLSAANFSLFDFLPLPGLSRFTSFSFLPDNASSLYL
jgi:hypothetical protein